jgi:hypothetical protein
LSSTCNRKVCYNKTASSAATLLKKAYGVNLTGYTTEASFSKSAVPNSDIWELSFSTPPNAQNSIASILGM